MVLLSLYLCVFDVCWMCVFGVFSLKKLALQELQK